MKCCNIGMVPKGKKRQKTNWVDKVIRWPFLLTFSTVFNYADID